MANKKRSFNRKFWNLSIKIGKKDFKKSNNNVKKAAILLPLLITFVAPGLFDPNVLGSGNEKNLENIIANGIEPTIYINKITCRVEFSNMFSII